MKPARVLFFAVSLCLILSGSALAQPGPDGPMGDAMGPKHMGIKALLDKNGKITKDEYMALAKERAEAAWKRMDPQGKGVVTKEEMATMRQERKEKRMMKKSPM